MNKKYTKDLEKRVEKLDYEKVLKASKKADQILEIFKHNNKGDNMKKLEKRVKELETKLGMSVLINLITGMTIAALLLKNIFS